MARECHFSFGSPSRKLLSAHRGCGLPVKSWQMQQKTETKGEGIWEMDQSNGRFYCWKL